MKKIVIADLKSNNAESLFRELSPTEAEIVSGGSGGSINNYFISAMTGNLIGSQNDRNGIDKSTTIRDNKVNTIDYSRAIYIIINSW
ncbi:MULTISPECIES: hypothetical protein [unclassified Anabaena]|uniref:hypothetical protein n=1 Tax=unclassified Anabaena TaxID=2619674 RepID=UPI001447CBDC|nr:MULTISPECIES: hypothetical protein [unclassified Anabaena]MTJ06839.1 hypothetical protein [Anabaena sp. UHCC 0204]MTJ54921.1 hypothetical protein [Anabaena sp. UHCC 0253]